MAGDPLPSLGTARPIFAEGLRQIAVVSGGVYYARNRVPDGDGNAFMDQVENGLSVVRDRDEVFLRLRYTF